MIIDNTLVLSDGQAITADANSTNIIDLGANGTAFGHSAAVSSDLGKLDNEGVEIAVSVTEAFNNLTSLKITLACDDNASLSSAKEIASRTYLLAELTLGARLEFPAKVLVGCTERYLGLVYDVTGTAPTTGKIFAAVVASRQSN